MSTNINDIIRLYVRREATAEQRNQIREFVFDNTDNFNILLKIMREEAMKEMGMDPADDFMPELLKERSPKAYAEFPIFDSNAETQMISADFADSNGEDDIFAMLCKEILGQPAAWY